MKTHERRRHRRHKIGIHATLVTPSTTIPVYATDVSIDGIRIVSPDPIPPETAVTLSLAVKEETVLTGHVLWSLEELQWGRRGFEIGIEVTAIILRKMRAIGFAEKEALLHEILSRSEHA